ncbi:hypothetical protein [Amycolatopsis sp. RTGN1]|uniref:restriction endonuclease subunit S n=1 Tax=Amycolatopsis ponsaeliensis TaxID=2992142 RepID=UPI00254E647C|nr:hypothetical protein [Amycolatopsis sp. RTGN1]
MTVPKSFIVHFSKLERWDSPQTPTSDSFLYPVACLGDIAEIRLGTQVPRKGAQGSGTDVPYLRAANVQRGYLSLASVKSMRVSPDTVERLELSPDDVLFVEGNSREEVGRSAVWTDSNKQMIIQNSIVRARLTSENVLPEFVSTWFNSDAGGTYIRDQATTTTGSLWHIGAGKLASAPLPIPPVNIQRELVATYSETLSRSDKAKQAAASIYSASWKQFISQLVTTKEASIAIGKANAVRFSSLERWDTLEAPTILSSAYPVACLGDIAEIRLGTQVPRKGAQGSGTDVPYLRAANVQRGYLSLASVKSMRVSPDTVERLELSPDDVLFVEGNSREEVGRSAVWTDSNKQMIIQNSIVRARLTSENVLPEFVSTWFNSDAGGTYIRDQATTTTGSLWHIGAGKLASAPLPIPPLEAQRSLVRDLKSGLKTASAAESDSIKIRDEAELDLRNALIQARPNAKLHNPAEFKDRARRGILPSATQQ